MAFSLVSVMVLRSQVLRQYRALNLHTASANDEGETNSCLNKVLKWGNFGCTGQISEIIIKLDCLAIFQCSKLSEILGSFHS